jgi:hypothetical protein
VSAIGELVYEQYLDNIKETDDDRDVIDCLSQLSEQFSCFYAIFQTFWLYEILEVNGFSLKNWRRTPTQVTETRFSTVVL